MVSKWIEAIDARSAGALTSGALQPVQAEQTEMEDGGMRFIVRWVSSLAVKDAAKAAGASQVAIPGGPRDPNFNPFLNPDPELTVGPLGDEHVVILNKFPLSERHLVLARRAFEEQLLPLARGDFAALATIMAEAGGIGLYNGGAAAGASQRHKHVQWMPPAEGNASLRLFAPGLPAGLPEQGVAQHPALPMKHCFVRVCCGEGVPVEVAADSLHAAYRLACETLDLQPGADGLLPPCNLLASDGWLLMLPRSEECFEGISMSAVCFGGTLYIRQPEQIESIRRVGPLKALAAVGY
ncbi:ATP adenylyltransferase family protein [Thauera linaloolentis]|uniref:Ap4A phosphorylase II n=1 Tax=Thauera linaloolentis (strain DSM 12138 / JCM 21573 / CCUG 41526 / CIP 105981 / IAM 15112 / NBRC 102519 / 47Lol) TaxID=1123367 RepID=N6YC70_THAL4|nr:phosphorylase [Thauera linaloolentis]ENO89125.1 Ap4A phosphorylase II [Thauera linaloolentis 47Lol = DSM 12138]MCM8565728.1 phosphorylase [Thauera linaloolentis]